MHVNRSVTERSQYTDVPGWVPRRRSDCPRVVPSYALSTNREPRFVTFVNPVPEKGVYPFVRIAHELGRRPLSPPAAPTAGTGPRPAPPRPG